MLDWLRNMTRSRRTRPAGTKSHGFRPFVEGMEERCLLATHFLQTNLVSNIAGLAQFTDPQLINPFGLTASSTSPFWVADNQVGLSTLYNGQGNKLGLVVNVPKDATSAFTHGAPTGIVFNTDTNPADFQVNDGTATAASIFIFATLDGTIEGWNGASKNAGFAVPQSNGAIFTGLAIDTSASSGNTLLYAADWWNGTVDVFNSSFKPATGLPSDAFQDKAIPSGFNPFGIQDINGHIFVTYAQVDPTTGADTGTGGFVAEFTREGVLEHTIVSSHFNSPWGLAMAPATGFGSFSGDLLVGGFGDGHINAFDPRHHFRFAGTLQDQTGKAVAVEDLWGIRFGNGSGSGSTTTLYFTAGITDAPQTNIFGATDGLFGSLQAIPTLRGPLVPDLPNAAVQSISTVPTTGSTAGDQNPYGVAFVPTNFKGTGVLQPGDLLVSDFNNAGAMGGQQGKGSTIMRFTPQGGSSIFFAGAPGLGLTTALGVLRNGDVIVGSLPTTDAGTIQPGALLVLDANGKLLETITDSQLLDSPWDLTINDRGNTAQVFVSNAVSGKVTRIDLSVPLGGTPNVESETLIGSGFTSQPNDAALILGPTGLAYDAKTGTLFVASTADNTIFAISHAGTRMTDAGTGRDIFHGHSNPNLRGPLGLVLAPNGDLIVANGDAVNANHPSELVEFTRGGKFVGNSPSTRARAVPSALPSSNRATS